MLEVCPTIADGDISIKVCPLSMGNREDPARLVFTLKTDPAVATSLIVIDKNTDIRAFKNELRWNAAVYR